MAFIFARYAAIFCGVAFLLALCADLVQFLVLVIVAHTSGCGVGYFNTRRGWLFVFALWWLISFVIALPLARRFSGLPFPFL